MFRLRFELAIFAFENINDLKKINMLSDSNSQSLNQQNCSLYQEQNRKDYEEMKRLINEFDKKREKELSDFMENNQFKERKRVVSNAIFSSDTERKLRQHTLKIVGVFLSFFIFMKVFTSA